MKIVVTAGRGEGNTTLSAFDAALNKAGIMNYNIIRLTSVIPPGTQVVEGKWPNGPAEHGKKLYTVLSDIRTDLLGRSIAAGIAWHQEKDGRGVFAEHTDIIESLNAKEAERNVRYKLQLTIEDLCKHRGYKCNPDKIKMVVLSTEVIDKPTCALVAAAYQSEQFK